MKDLHTTVAYLLVFGITCKRILSNNNVVKGFVNNIIRCLKKTIIIMKRDIFRRSDIQSGIYIVEFIIFNGSMKKSLKRRNNWNKIASVSCRAARPEAYCIELFGLVITFGFLLDELKPSRALDVHRSTMVVQYQTPRSNSVTQTTAALIPAWCVSAAKANDSISIFLTPLNFNFSRYSIFSSSVKSQNAPSILRRSYGKYSVYNLTNIIYIKYTRYNTLTNSKNGWRVPSTASSEMITVPPSSPIPPLVPILKKTGSTTLAWNISLMIS
ncbi:hypothetical protein AGLY_000171, partial [Aphis glycines]